MERQYTLFQNRHELGYSFWVEKEQRVLHTRMLTGKQLPVHNAALYQISYNDYDILLYNLEWHYMMGFRHFYLNFHQPKTLPHMNATHEIMQRFARKYALTAKVEINVIVSDVCD